MIITTSLIWIWFGLMAVMLIIELFTAGLTTIWFAAGSLCAMAVSAFGAGLAVQIIVFAAVSILLLLFTRPLAMRYLNRQTHKTNAEALVGRKVRVTKDINNLKDEGEVVANGLPWKARSSDDTVTFRCDEQAVVEGIEGVKLIVSKVDAPATDTAD